MKYLFIFLQHIIGMKTQVQNIIFVLVFTPHFIVCQRTSMVSEFSFIAIQRCLATIDTIVPVRAFAFVDLFYNY